MIQGVTPLNMYESLGIKAVIIKCLTENGISRNTVVVTADITRWAPFQYVLICMADARTAELSFTFSALTTVAPPRIPKKKSLPCLFLNKLELYPIS